MADDKTLEVIYRWKEVAIAGFLLVSMVIGLAAVLLVELAGLRRIWEIERRPIVNKDQEEVVKSERPVMGSRRSSAFADRRSG